MNLWMAWISISVVGIGLYEGVQYLRQRRRERAAEWVQEFCAKFPGRCPVCSFTRWGREMGISAAWKPVEPHPCPETTEAKEEKP